MKNFRKVIAVISAFIIVFSFCSCEFSTEEEKLSKEFYAMDTVIDIDLIGDDKEEVYTKIEELVKEVDTQWLSRTESGSCIYKINKACGGTLEPQLVSYITTLIIISSKSGGAYNFQMGYLSDLWGFGKEEQSVPEEEKIETVVEAISGSVALDPSTSEIQFSNILINLDMGSAGKGIALDEIKSVLENSATEECVAALGGSILLYGERDFSVGIKDPNSSGYIATLTIPASCVSTSGNYERYFEQDGKRYHHILDPETGYPVENGLASVTVVSQNGTISDALSTACFVKGIDDSQSLLEEFDCQGVFVTEDKKIYTDSETAKILQITDSSYTLVLTDEK